MRKADIKPGTRFGYWTVIELPGTTKHDYVRCRCVCGREKLVYIYNLIGGKSLSCGCKRKDGDNRELADGRQRLTDVHKRHVAVKYSGFGRRNNKNNGTGITGVSLFRDGRYRAYISVDGKQIHLGYYDKLEDAKAAREEAEQRYFADRQEKADELMKKDKRK